MNAFLDQTKNTGDQMDYGQRNNDDIGEEVRQDPATQSHTY
jgi:hypothetical protein